MENKKRASDFDVISRQLAGAFAICSSIWVMIELYAGDKLGDSEGVRFFVVFLLAAISLGSLVYAAHGIETWDERDAEPVKKVGMLATIITLIALVPIILVVLILSLVFGALAGMAEPLLFFLVFFK